MDIFFPLRRLCLSLSFLFFVLLSLSSAFHTSPAAMLLRHHVLRRPGLLAGHATLSLSRYHSTHKRSSTESETETSVSHALPLSLTAHEQRLFDHLKAFIAEKKLHTTVRVAGGWVRDKLLGVPGKNDVDLALDNMTGLQFVSELNKWNEEHGREKRKYGVIQQNPDKSKHLETVSFQFEDIGVDLVNLRTESYCENSRVPLSVAIGTPAEDALRRDLTINALFFNIHTHCVEDFTQLGLEDLTQRRIRTPLSPLVTFTDDPLRALRAIRFACRFRFDIDPALLAAASESAVHACLLQKVSRERIYHEIELMMQTEQFNRAMALLRKTRLWRSLLALPQALFVPRERPVSASGSGSVTVNKTETSRAQALREKRERYAEVSEHDRSESVRRLRRDMHEESVLCVLLDERVRARASERGSHLNAWADMMTKDPVERRLFVYALGMLPCRDFATIPTGGKHPQALSGVLLQHELKLSSKDFRAVEHLVEATRSFGRLLALTEDDPSASCTAEGERDFLSVQDLDELDRCRCGGEREGRLQRLDLGLAVRDVGPRYSSVVVLAALREAMDALYKDLYVSSSEESGDKESSVFTPLLDELVAPVLPSTPTAETSSPRIGALDKRLDESLQRAHALLRVVDKLQLEHCWEEKPLLDGHALLKLFPKLSKDKMIGRAVEAQKKWMLCKPHGSREELEEFLRSRYSAYR